MQNKLNKAPLVSLILLSIWIVFPLTMFVFNATKMSYTDSYRIWISVLFITGGLSYLPGLYFLSNKITEAKLTAKETVFALAPLLIFVLFFVWNIICTAFCDFPLLAIFGKVPASDCLCLYFSLGGMMLSGITVASNKQYLKILSTVFISMATILTFISLPNNELTTAICVNDFTNTPEYQSVFYNTNHFAYYLTIALVLCAHLIQNSKTRNTKIAYSIIFVLLTAMLIKNNTMGSYLAVTLALIFAIIWAFINKEEKKDKFFVFGLFIIASFLIQLSDNGVASNFSSMFSDLNTITSSTASENEINSAGSGRIMLWRAAIVFIKTHPIIGWGPANIALSAHNTYLQLMIYSGIPGLLIYLSAFVVGAIRLVKSRMTITPSVKACGFAVVAYLISAFFGLTVFYTAPYFYIIVGVCMSSCLGKLTEE